jgi:S-adenosylmethionine:tRNA ribosyltransferase-isomerase
VRSIDLDDYDYELPEALIAPAPAPHRADSSLMLVGPDRGAVVPFSRLPESLEAGDLLVLNNTRVVPCRLTRRRHTGGQVEVFVLGPTNGGWHDGPGPVQLHVLTRPGRKLSEGEPLGDIVLNRRRDDGSWDATAALTGTLLEWVQGNGAVPLPPYITRRRRTLGMDDLGPEDEARYQTVYAEHPGAVAAPTAGLHFTPLLFEELASRGVETAFVTLHVGIGTFKPLDEQSAQRDHLHGERYAIGPDLPGALTRARRVIAVGTTTLRALEDQASRFGPRAAAEGAYTTNLFIKPGFAFGTTDRLITNFHLPRSSLLVLVSAFAGQETIRRAYADAIDRELRFYSYGDAMLLTRRP